MTSRHRRRWDAQRVAVALLWFLFAVVALLAFDVATALLMRWFLS